MAISVIPIILCESALCTYFPTEEKFKSSKQEINRIFLDIQLDYKNTEHKHEWNKKDSYYILACTIEFIFQHLNCQQLMMV